MPYGQKWGEGGGVYNFALEEGQSRQPFLDAAVLLTVGSCLLTVGLLCLQLCLVRAFLLTATVGAFSCLQL